MISAFQIHRPTRFTRLLPGLLLILLTNPTAAAENSIKNGGFYKNLKFWDVSSADTHEAEWSDKDVDGHTLSGSAKLINTYAGNNGVGTILSQCVERDTDASLVNFGASAWVDEEDANGVGAYIFVYEHDNSDCSDYIGREQLMVNKRESEWKHASTSFTPDNSTQSFKVTLGVWKAQDAGTSGLVYYDNVWLEQEVLPLFDDRFEK